MESTDQTFDRKPEWIHGKKKLFLLFLSAPNAIYGKKDSVCVQQNSDFSVVSLSV